MSSGIIKSQVISLSLRNFRNYLSVDFEPESDFSIILGPNGVGKTNILEAISMLSPGRGLRGSKTSDIEYFEGKGYGWSVSADIKGSRALSRINTFADGECVKRSIEIDDKNASQADLSRMLSISWLVPQMGHIFIDSSSARRKFLDRMVSNFDPSHTKNIYSYEHHMKERANLLKNDNYDETWMRVIERKMSESGVMIATSRVQFAEMVMETLGVMKYKIPEFSMKIGGMIEEKIYRMPSVQIEDEFYRVLRENRSLDALSKRTNAGIHRSDLLIYKADCGTRADMCSTGEQKFLLVSVFLTEIVAQIRHKKKMPVILLDDASAHLDRKSQEVFLKIVKDIGAQTWITSTFIENFDFLKGNAEFYKVEKNKIMIRGYE
jgi:DNA replication and repair protein RecF